MVMEDVYKELGGLTAFRKGDSHQSQSERCESY